MRKILAFLTIGVLALGCSSSTPAPAASGSPTPASGGETTAAPSMVNLDVHNGSSTEICFLYISPVSDTHWGPDVLGSRTLSPDETDHYEMTPGAWDFKAEDCSHHELFQLRNQTVAEHSVLTLHN